MKMIKIVTQHYMDYGLSNPSNKWKEQSSWVNPQHIVSIDIYNRDKGEAFKDSGVHYEEDAYKFTLSNGTIIEGISEFKEVEVAIHPHLV